MENNLALSRVKIRLKPVLGWAGSRKAEAFDGEKPHPRGRNAV